jgi:hypothetical protein
MNRRVFTLAVAIILVGLLVGGYAFYSGMPNTSVSEPEETATVSATELISEVSREQISEHIRTLAGPEFQGRLAGDTGQYKAAEYISQQFTAYGLKPVADENTYYQWFTYPFWRPIAPVHFSEIGGDNRAWTVTTDFTVFQYSGAGNVSGQVVFVGYGITLPQKQYDDYAGIDVRGKIALVFRHGPNGDQTWQDQFGVWGFGYKVRNAHDHGAAGLILINRYQQPSEPGTGTLTGEGNIEGFPVIWAARTVGEYLLAGTGKTLSELQTSTDTRLEPSPLETGKRVILTVTAEFDSQRRTMNVIGAIEGQDPALGEEVVIVSAHYDHLGPTLSGEIYYGADDDASGMAGVLEAARVLSKFASRAAFTRTVVFAAWSAEEEGLVGSSYYVGKAIFPLAKTVAVIQLDMIGAGNGEGVLAFNGKDAPSLTERLAQAGSLVGLQVIPEDSATNSDHAPFAQRGVDAILLYTQGSHPNYHTINDRPEFIDEALAHKVTQIVVVATWSLSTGQAIQTSSVSPVLGPVLVIYNARRLI